MNENHYELLVIVTGAISDAELEGVRVMLEELLKKHDSTIHYMHNLGRRKLAYSIKRQAHGTYLLCEFDAPGEHIKKLERALALTTELLRHCIVRRKKVGTPIPLERREEEAGPVRRTGAPRKTQDEELLGKAAPLSDEETSPRETIAIAAAPEETPAPVIPTPVLVLPKEEPPIEETSTPEEGAKKKGKKASYEELDQKLNELLSDDII